MIERRSFVEEAPSGERLRGDVRRPAGREPASAVVVVHGFKGFKDWGFFPHLCERLADAGHAAVSFNVSHNGIGENPEAFTELERFGRNTFTRELDEIRWILGRVLDGGLTGSPPRSVGLLGHSRGGGQAVLAAGEESRLDALVTWAAVSHYDRWSDTLKAEWRRVGRITAPNARTGQDMPLDVTLLEDYEANRERLDVGAASARLRAPWLVVHGEADETVPVEEGRMLARSGRTAELLVIEGAGHTFQARHPFEGPTEELDRAIEATLAHFGRHLGA